MPRGRYYTVGVVENKIEQEVEAERYMCQCAEAKEGSSDVGEKKDAEVDVYNCTARTAGGWLD